MYIPPGIYVVEVRSTCDSTIAFVGLTEDELLGFKRAVAQVNDLAFGTPTLHIKPASEMTPPEWDQYFALVQHQIAFNKAKPREQK